MVEKAFGEEKSFNIHKMRKFVGKLKRRTPYYLQKGAPAALKEIWSKKLFTRPSQYLVYHLFSHLLLKPYFCAKRLFNFSKGNNQFHKLKTDLILRDQIHPEYISTFQLFDKSHWENRHQYLYHKSMIHCLSLLSSSSDAVNLLNDKYQFSLFCMENDITIPTTFGWVNSAGQLSFDSIHLKNIDDFVVKPFVGNSGKGFTLFEFDTKLQSYITGRKDQPIGKDTLGDILKRLAIDSKTDLLIQEKIVHHPIFEKLGNGALTTIRVLSILDKNGKVKLFSPILIVPQNSARLSFMHKGAAGISMDLGSGRMMNFIANGKDASAELKKRVNQNFGLPYWDELKSLLIKAHGLLNEIPLIGWDVAISKTGIKLIEGNSNPSLDIHQLPPQEPMIGTEFYYLLMDHLRK